MLEFVLLIFITTHYNKVEAEIKRYKNGKDIQTILMGPRLRFPIRLRVPLQNEPMKNLTEFREVDLLTC